ncbi:MAG: hypothetical protein KC457_07525 [Myxococcales bacterium]|nr:hypothetical protein [Myxococcales bacterium]
MFEDSILDVALGMVFLYALLSLVTTAITEGIANLFSLRSRALHSWLEDMLGDTWTSAAGRQRGITRELLGHPLIRAMGKNDRAPDYIPPETFTAVLLEILSRPDQQQLRHRPRTYPELRAMVFAIDESPPLRQVLLNLTASPRRDIHEAEAAVERWFDASMDSLRHWYGRRMQIVAFIFATATVLLVNADSLMFADALWQNSDLRVAVAERATGLDVRTHEQRVQGEGEGEGQPGEVDKKALAKDIEQLRAIDGFPLGWSADPLDRRHPPKNVLGWLMKLLGLGLTVLATTLGAPFWFGLLSKVVSLRKAPPESRANQANQDLQQLLTGAGGDGGDGGRRTITITSEVGSTTPGTGV